MHQYLLKVSGNTNLEEEAHHCPLPLKVISEDMKIDLKFVSAIMWTETQNGRLVDITIAFNQGGSKVENYN